MRIRGIVFQRIQGVVFLKRNFIAVIHSFNKYSLLLIPAVPNNQNQSAP